jgi:hypothetical protein
MAGEGLLFDTGTYLGAVYVAALAAFKQVHGPGGVLDGYQPNSADQARMLSLSFYYAYHHMQQQSQERGQDG